MNEARGLVLSGGGARAAYQVGVLQGIAQIGRAAGRAPGALFEVICGTSAGAINAAVLACGADDTAQAVADLADVWGHFQAQQVYRVAVSDMLSSGARWLSWLSLGWWLTQKAWRPRAFLDLAPLAALLQERVRWDRLPGLIHTGPLRALAITASSYSTGEHVTFFQARPEVQGWRRNQRVAQATPLQTAHLLASAAIPFVFPTVRLDGPSGAAYFGDGAIRQTAPLSPAIHLGARRILVIGAGRMVEPAALGPAVAQEPSMAQIAGHALSSIFLDALAVDIERLRRINQTLALIPPERQHDTPLRPIEVLLIAPSQRLDALALEHWADLPATVRSLMSLLGAPGSSDSPQGAALLSYVLFEAPYTQRLMALGYADALAQDQAIRNFFNWPD